MWRQPGEAACTWSLRRTEAASDTALLGEFLRDLSYGSRYFRFGHGDAVLGEAEIASLCSPDPREGVAYILTCEGDAGTAAVGLAGYCVDADDGCELALVVADAWQGRGMGRRLIAALADDARRRGLRTMTGRVLATNHRMLACARQLGFEIQPWADSRVVLRAVLRLDGASHNTA